MLRISDASELLRVDLDDVLFDEGSHDILAASFTYLQAKWQALKPEVLLLVYHLLV